MNERMDERTCCTMNSMSSSSKSMSLSLPNRRICAQHQEDPLSRNPIYRTYIHTYIHTYMHTHLVVLEHLANLMLQVLRHSLAGFRNVWLACRTLHGRSNALFNAQQLPEVGEEPASLHSTKEARACPNMLGEVPSTGITLTRR